MIRLLALPLLALPLAGCPALDVMEGKESPYKAAHEARTALLIPEAEVATMLDVVAPCHEEFRVRRCVGGQAVEWFYGDAP